MTESLRSRRVVVGGRVQGVFFRDSVRRLAIEACVAGWAANRPDGTVEIVLEGNADAVDRLVDFCGRGPSRARVERIEVSEAPVAGLRGFDVR